MATRAFYDRTGMKIGPNKWLELREDRNYTIVREFDNGAVYVTVEWVGKVVGELFRSCWPLFKITVQNYDSTGVLREDPADSGKTFATEADAINFYEDFLLKYTESDLDLDENGHPIFVEKGNQLDNTPEEPPSEFDAYKDPEDEVGVW